MEPKHIFLFVWSIMTIGILVTMYLRGKKALAIFPNIETVKLLFREKGASGSSRKSLKTRLGGASKVLEIIITQEELWIRSPLLTAGVGKTYDMLHKVPLNEILNVESNKRNVIISFKTANNSETTLDLKLKKGQEFVEIIKKSIA